MVSAGQREDIVCTVSCEFPSSNIKLITETPELNTPRWGDQLLMVRSDRNALDDYGTPCTAS